MIIIYYLSFIITDRIFSSSKNRAKDSANEFEIMTPVKSGEIVSKDKRASVQKYSKSSLTKEQIAEYAATINAYFEKEKPYLDFEFSFSQLSQVLNISTHQLSQTFNESFGKTYPQVIKELRIQEAVKRLQDEKYAHLSIYGIALDCGFNSKSLFNQAFKEITGFTPQVLKRPKIPLNRRPLYFRMFNLIG
ncbi:MAG: AraC family transcriptional regulator [Cyclobacteriaceae bacterium]|nr:MAG: AraC family transcriptional regulator [Cyclobacteriaceae bacterium]